MEHDVFKILKDLELKTVGLDPGTNKMSEGYFVSFRTVGLPIHAQDFSNPWSPLGANLEKSLNKDIPQSAPVDPKDAPKTASSTLDENKIFAARIGHDMQSYLNTFLLVDEKLRMNNEYSIMPGAGNVSDAWWAITTGANGIPVQSVLNDAMKKAYEEATAKLMDKDGNTTPHYEAYMQYEQIWRDKVKTWHRTYANAFTDPMKLQNWPIDGVLYQDDADEAMDRWTSLGFKQEIENAIAILAAQGIDPAIALISRAKKRYINSLNQFMNIGELPYTLMSPNSWYDANNDEGWYDYGSADFHAESHYQSSSTSYGGGGGFSIGFWSADGGFERGEQRKSFGFQIDGLEIGFKYCAVDVKRPWLVSDLLNTKNWFLMGDYKKGCISNGTMAQELPQGSVPQVFLPSIVTSLILIKDLRIKWRDAKAQWDSKVTDDSGGGSIGFGPFAVSGRYRHHGEQRDFEADWQGEWLTVPGIQVVGYVSMINPPSPAVDSSEYLAKPQTTPDHA